jgi:CxxC motif-containing protein (DUF1111 family)
MSVCGKLLTVVAGVSLVSALEVSWAGDGGKRKQLDAAAPEAVAGFDALTNGVASQAQFDLDREIFDEQEEIDEGLGPLFNSRSCGECHSIPISGGASQITEVRAGSYTNGGFTDHPGGSLIHDRAIDARCQERIGSANVQALRLSLNVLGDGFIEAIADSTLVELAAMQPPTVRGTVIHVPVLEAGGALRVGRFGWKNQHASLVSFSADAYLNEMGITSPLAPEENSQAGHSIAEYDYVADPEEAPTPDEPTGPDIEAFARFMRSTKVPPRSADASSSSVQNGESVFARVGCSQCHVQTIVTAPAGTLINGGMFAVPEVLGGKAIHPFSDFLLHDVGTGDGIVQNGGPATRNMLRTPPLWGLRLRTRLMHDGNSRTIDDAILRHARQATTAVTNFKALSSSDRADLFDFLDSL